MFRFSDYDLFAYVAAGLAALACYDIIFHTNIVIVADWSISTGTGTIFLAYIIGQILASPSAFLLERQIVRRTIGMPSTLLFRTTEDSPNKFLRLFFGDYLAPLDANIQRRVLSRATSEGNLIISGESLFWTAYSAARYNRLASIRMEAFLKLYGFCRNLSFVGCIMTLTLTSKWIWHLLFKDNSPEIFEYWHITIACTIGTLIMFSRYLKFLRLFNVEVFLTYIRRDTPAGRKS